LRLTSRCFFLFCGALDISRHFKITPEMARSIFSAMAFRPGSCHRFNLLADMLSARNLGTYRLEICRSSNRAEIEACVKAFIDNGGLIKARVAAVLGDKKRGMLTFKWYAKQQDITVRIPAFEQDYRYIKTIAVSVFNTREKTSWHFGPLRLTFRVLYNLDPVDSDQVFINVDDKTHFWNKQPLFVFDDTLFHRSVNDVDQARYCLFMDIVRPNHLQPCSMPPSPAQRWSRPPSRRCSTRTGRSSAEPQANHCTRITTVSAAPVASITVNRAKPAPADRSGAGGGYRYRRRKFHSPAPSAAARHRRP